MVAPSVASSKNIDVYVFWLYFFPVSKTKGQRTIRVVVLVLVFLTPLLLQPGSPP